MLVDGEGAVPVGVDVENGSKPTQKKPTSSLFSFFRSGGDAPGLADIFPV